MADHVEHVKEEEECSKDDKEDEAIQSLLRLSKIPDTTSFQDIVHLNLSDCQLSTLPSTLPTSFPNLSILFLSNNSFSEMPALIGECPKLQMVAFKNNNMRTIHPDALQAPLRWLILTHNQITHLPDTIGRCVNLQKCMLSGNALTTLPMCLGEKCHALELIRLASNQLQEPPTAVLSQLPKLAWVALSDNPFLKNSNTTTTIPTLSILYECGPCEDILGQGAGGTTYQAWLQSTTTPVAVKVPPDNGNNMTSDGKPDQEQAIHTLVSAGVPHDLICPVLGRHPDNNGLVMEFLDNYHALAGPPSLTTCTRDVYPEDTVVSKEDASSILTTILNVLTILHTQLHICHGDVYAHNILVHDSNPPRLTDWGASFVYPSSSCQEWLERVELRALAVLAEELQHNELALQCRQPDATCANVQVWWLQHERLKNMEAQYTESLKEHEEESTPSSKQGETK